MRFAIRLLFWSKSWVQAFGVAARRFAIRWCVFCSKSWVHGIRSSRVQAFGVAARRFAIRLCSLVKVLGTGIRSSSEAVCH